MVLVEPDRLVDGSRLAGSAARYHPSVRIWQYAQSGICELRDSAAEPPRPEPEIRVSPAPDRARVVTPAPVSQRTTGDGVHELKRPAMGVDDTGASSGVTLTAEELAMLLGDDPSPGGGKNA
jgi:hypothetical protein